MLAYLSVVTHPLVRLTVDVALVKLLTRVRAFPGPHRDSRCPTVHYVAVGRS